MAKVAKKTINATRIETPLGVFLLLLGTPLPSVMMSA